VIVFRPEDEKTPPGDYREATERTRTALARGPLSIDDPGAVRDYFDRYYGEGADLGKQEQKVRCEELAFRSLARAFEMISDLTQTVFVGYDAAGRALIERLLAWGQLNREMLRGLQRYTVGLYPNEFALAQRGVIKEVRPDSNLWVCQEGCYDESLGLLLSRGAGEMVF
jgi:CRISPR-associated endonuclease/helicase Cas3